MVVQNPLSNALQGIQLAQNGHKTDALAYLRESVQREPVNAEVWLWLAHVTPDIHEYQNCIYQALLLDPNHVVARQMQEAILQLQYSGQFPQFPNTGQMPAAQAQAPIRHTAEMNQNVLLNAQKRQRRRWWLQRCLFITVGGTLIGVITAIIAIIVTDPSVIENLF